MTPRVQSFITALAMVCIAAAFFWFGTEVHAQQALLAATKVATHRAADRAKELARPVAASIGVPRPLNHDHDVGPARGGMRDRADGSESGPHGPGLPVTPTLRLLR